MVTFGETTALLPKINPKKRTKKRGEEERRRGGKGRRGERQNFLTLETKNGVVDHSLLHFATFFAPTRKTRTIVNDHAMGNGLSHERWVVETPLVWCMLGCLPTTN